MNILNRLIRRITRGKSIIWGLRVSKGVKERWQWLARLMGIPANRLVLYVLQDWAWQNRELIADRQARNALAGRITDAFLNNELK